MFYLLWGIIFYPFLCASARPRSQEQDGWAVGSLVLNMFPGREMDVLWDHFDEPTYRAHVPPDAKNAHKWLKSYPA